MGKDVLRSGAARRPTLLTRTGCAAAGVEEVVVGREVHAAGALGERLVARGGGGHDGVWWWVVRWWAVGGEGLGEAR